MLTLLGSLLGFIGSAVPRLLTFFERKQDNEHEYRMVELQQRGVAAAAQQALDLANVNADISEFKSLQQYGNVKTGTWVDVLTASVRPVITYCFFALFVFVEVKTAQVVFAMNDLSVLTKLGMVWNQEVQALFAAIMSFWFGARSLQKGRERAGSV